MTFEAAMFLRQYVQQSNSQLVMSTKFAITLELTLEIAVNGVAFSDSDQK
jgi:hypothetical protein